MKLGGGIAVALLRFSLSLNRTRLQVVSGIVGNLGGMGFMSQAAGYSILTSGSCDSRGLHQRMPKKGKFWDRCRLFITSDCEEYEDILLPFRLWYIVSISHLVAWN